MKSLQLIFHDMNETAARTRATTRTTARTKRAPDRLSGQFGPERAPVKNKSVLAAVF